jgi:hypothetical protein
LKTSYVTATIYGNDRMGENIGFKFPKNPGDSDREEIDEFFTEHGGGVYQGGGLPGAESFVIFKDVKDYTSAERKLQEILPILTVLIENINNDAYIKRFQAAYDKWDRANLPQWPDTTPPDKTDPFWEMNNNMSINSVLYRKVEVAPGKWQWQVDQETLDEMKKADAHRHELFNALKTRVLTDAELREAVSYGYMFNIDDNVGYDPEQKKRELDEAFAMQTRLWREAKITQKAADAS